jgi:hypothetical protein
MTTFVCLILIPIFIWIVIGSYKELRQRLNIENDWDELIFPIIWIGGLIFGIITMTRELLLGSG